MKYAKDDKRSRGWIYRVWLCNRLTQLAGTLSVLCCAGLGQRKARWVGLDLLQERLENFSGFVFGHEIVARQRAEFDGALPGQ